MGEHVDAYNELERDVGTPTDVDSGNIERNVDTPMDVDS
jgi:hypothetical protein